MEALETSDRLGLARYEWVQNEYNLLHRGAEDGVLSVCEREGLGFTPFSPLAGGWLTGKYGRDRAYPPGSRMTLRPEPYSELENERTFAPSRSSWRGQPIAASSRRRWRSPGC